MIVGLDHVEIATPPGADQRARRFYGELLGLAEIPKPPTLAARGGVWFALGDERQLHLGIDPQFEPARKAHPAFALDSPPALEALAATLAHAGHQPVWDSDLPGARRFYVEDPFGNRLELLVRQS